MTDEQIEKAARDYVSFEKGGNCYPNYAVECACRRAFIDGADFALSHQWISVEERLPEDDRYFYFVADARLDPLGVDCAEYTCETKLFSRNGKILHPTHWMPIPQLNPETQSI